MMRLEDCIKERVLILDGAMGSLLTEYGLGGGNNDMLCLTRADVISDIHERYLRAGADIITTNTFNAQRISQADYHTEHSVRDMNLAAALIARKAADRYSTLDKPRFVAGSVGPTNKTCSMSPDVNDPSRRDMTYDELYAAYCEQIDALVEGGVDAILIETIFDTLNAKCAINAAQGRGLPVMLSVTISDAAGRTLSGQTLQALLASVSTYDVFSIGLNCSFGARQMKPYLQELSQCAPYYISAYPNAGLPNELGLYDETAETMAPQIGEFINERLVNIVGGCCGTTPDFIERYVPMVSGALPHVPAKRPDSLWLSGLEMLDTAKSAAMFTNVGERCNVAGSRRFLRLISEKKYDEALSIARQQVDDGAMVIDINMDDALLDADHEMTHFLNLIAAEPDIARVPVMIDSSKWPVIVSALKCVQGKSIVNSISLKEGESVFLSHARDVKRLGAAVVVMCFDEAGQATTYERRISIAQRSYQLLTEVAGLSPNDIIFDPNILAIATGMSEHDTYALDFIRATEWIRRNLPGAHVSGGVSNLSFSFRGNNYLREAMHAVFLYHAVHAGMDFGIVNPSSKVTYDDIPQEHLTVIEDAILCRRPDAAERLIELSMTTGTAPDKQPAKPTCCHEAGMTVEERLTDALIKGDGRTLEADIDEALAKYSKATDIIDGPLMAGMNEVGRRFGEGRMFLPQVVKTARTMKQAVDMITSKSLRVTANTASAGKVLLATVKGDVHDIGKNIVSVVMACNGYEIIDLGVMVPASEIVKKAVEEHVDIIGLSGLITPSLEEMVNVARALRNAGLDIPIMIGGATTSALHVALKIAPVYEGPVAWMKDASQNPIMAARLMKEPDKVAQELSSEQESMRRQYGEQQTRLLTIDEARQKKPSFFNT